MEFHNYFLSTVNTPDHWIDYDVIRMLYTFGDNLSSIVCVDNASNYGRVDIRNYFIHRMGKISTNIVWTCAKIMPIKFKDFEWLEYLTTFTKMLSIEQYECYVLFSLYPKYMMESNVRYFIANLQSFTYMNRFLYILHCSFSGKLSAMYIRQMFNAFILRNEILTLMPELHNNYSMLIDIILSCGKEKQLKISLNKSLITTDNFNYIMNTHKNINDMLIDDLFDLILSKTDSQTKIFPTFNNLEKSLKEILELSATKPKKLIEMSMPLMVDISYYPRWIINSILLLVFRCKEPKTKTSMFADMIVISESFNRNMIGSYGKLASSSTRGAANKRVAEEDSSDNADEN